MPSSFSCFFYSSLLSFNPFQFSPSDCHIQSSSCVKQHFSLSLSLSSHLISFVCLFVWLVRRVCVCRWMKSICVRSSHFIYQMWWNWEKKNTDRTCTTISSKYIQFVQWLANKYKMLDDFMVHCTHISLFPLDSENVPLRYRISSILFPRNGEIINDRLSHWLWSFSQNKMTKHFDQCILLKQSNECTVQFIY